MRNVSREPWIDWDKENRHQVFVVVAVNSRKEISERPRLKRISERNGRFVTHCPEHEDNEVIGTPEFDDHKIETVN